MDSKSSFDAYRMPDAMWEKIQPLLPDVQNQFIWGKTKKGFAVRRGRNFLPTTYGLPMECDSPMPCSGKYGARLFPGMG
jgi:hypothetical protein